jgi:hypothetical protein
MRLSRISLEYLMSTKMVADMPFPYDGKQLKAGDEFTASENDALALRAYRRAHPADQAEEPKKRSKRTYKRRDMTAENP